MLRFDGSPTGPSVPLPAYYSGAQKVVLSKLDQSCLLALGRSAADVGAATAIQNLIPPAVDQEIVRAMREIG